MADKPRFWFSRRRENEEEWLSRLDQERREGRTLLRNMVKSEDDEDLDWKMVIKKAEELHQKHERSLSRRERKFRLRETKKAVSELRKADAFSFSVNLLTMKTCEEDNNAILNWRERVRSSTADSATSSFGDD